MSLMVSLMKRKARDKNYEFLLSSSHTMRYHKMMMNYLNSNVVGNDTKLQTAVLTVLEHIWKIGSSSGNICNSELPLRQFNLWNS